MGHELTHQNRRLSQSKSDWVKQLPAMTLTA